MPPVSKRETGRRFGGLGGAKGTHRHFFAAAAEAMRRILVDQARRKSAHKHGGHMQRVAANLEDLRQPRDSDDLLAIDAALDKLAGENPLVARLVELKYFAGLTLDEAAASLNVAGRPLRAGPGR